jgi:hypothetical protein
MGIEIGAGPSRTGEPAPIYSGLMSALFDISQKNQVVLCCTDDIGLEPRRQATVFKGRNVHAMSAMTRGSANDQAD